MRSIITFLTGFIAGMLFLLVMLWSHGSLQAVKAASPAHASVSSVAPVSGQPISPATAPIVMFPAPPPTSLPQQTLINEVPPLIVPVEGADVSKVLDTFAESRSGGDHRHEATDIMAARGTPVLAAAEGTVAKLFKSRRGGITIYQFDPTRTWCYYYAHLDHYAEGLREGSDLRQGQVIGYVGSTGDASPTAPHLHFAISKLGPEKHWWQGTAVNPYPVLMRHARK